MQAPSAMSGRIRAATALLAFAMAGVHCLGVSADAPVAQGPPWRIVILHGSDGQLPASTLADRAFREVVEANGVTRVEIFPEDLDTIRFPAAQLDAELVALLRKKHATRPPHVVVAFANNALVFAERHHQELWPQAALIFMGVEERALAAARGAHAATGVLANRQNVRTLELALRLLPDTKRVVLVSGASDWDHDTMSAARAELAQFAGRVEFEYLEDIPFAAVLKRIAEVPDGTLILPISMFRDSLGQSFASSEAASKMAQVARVPAFASVDTRIGRGMVGGQIIKYAEQGREAGQLVLEVFAGKDPRSLPLRVPGSVCAVDWRALHRWNIPMSRVPSSCEVLYRQPTYWEENWPVALGATAIIVLQAFLITILTVQHRRRRAAEMESQRQHAQLAHASRLATVGELTASIAHEINQPLGAILSNADAAEILLESPDPNLTEVRHILTDIRRDDERASAVIQRLRALLARHELDRQRLDPNTVAREAIALISQEADRRRTRLVDTLETSLPAVQGDRVHLVQVLLILLLNALDAMQTTPPERRQVTIGTSYSDSWVEFSVGDSGPGIPAADFPRLFDSFFTTKAKGMGLGLSIARSIVEAHGGRIWAEESRPGGAVFRFRLPPAS